MRRIVGLLTLLIVLGAVALAAVLAWLLAPELAVGYLVACVVGGMAILFAFCSRCPCNDRCGHVLPGPVARKLFPHRSPEPYRFVEIVITAVSIVVVLLVPVAWLWRYPEWLAVYVGSSVVAVILIRIMVCRGCENRYCPARPSGVRSSQR